MRNWTYVFCGLVAIAAFSACELTPSGDQPFAFDSSAADVSEDATPLSEPDLPPDGPVAASPGCEQVPAGMPCCGDGICDGPETPETCAADCPGEPGGPDGPGDEPIACGEVPPAMPCCGDGICDGPETGENCAGDCGGDPVDDCGDGQCQPGEAESCPADCPATPAASFPVVDTGLENCLSGTDCVDACPTAGTAGFGQDAQYVGAHPSYQDNGDGTITDLVTGLMWVREPLGKMTFDEAVSGAATFSLAGHDDWRLPTIKELYSLIVFSGMDPSGYSGTDTSGLVPFIDTDYFGFEYGDTSAGERIIDAQYWSATEYVSTTMGGFHTIFGVNFADGRIKGYGAPPQMEMQQFVKYVRGGDGSYGVNDFVDLGGGVVHDNATGLSWTQADSGEGMVWDDALDYCEGLSLGGHDDWRLPNAKELESIVDYGRSPDTTASPAIDPVFGSTSITNEAGQTDWPHYWTGTTHMNYMQPGANGAYVCFGRCMGYMNGQWIDVHGAGAQRSDPKTGDPSQWPTGHGPQGDAIRIYNFARCVRDGEVSLVPAFAPAECPLVTGGGTDPVGPDPGGTDPGTGAAGPVACTVQSDCEAPGACPPDASLGCTCTEIPTGGSACIPACNVDADCPAPPDTTMTCALAGLCVPSGGGPGAP